MNLPIRDYAIIGNMRSAALVSSEGSIDWCCLPRFDSPALFLRILDEEKGGFCAVRPTGKSTTRRAYLANTNILQTVFHQTTGRMTLTDFMPIRQLAERRPHGQHAEAEPRIIRLLRCTRGTIDCRIELYPTFGNASRKAHILSNGGIFSFQAASESLHVQLDAPVKVRNERLTSTVRLRAGESLAVVLTYAKQRPARMPRGVISNLLKSTTEYWEQWADKCSYDGEYREAVIRSALALKLLIYEPSGAIIAAPTSSLPEWISGKRNWDYRYSWLRDSSLTVAALMHLGYFEEARDFVEFLRRTLPVSAKDYQTMYAVGGEDGISEKKLKGLRGYRNSRPVRIGNGAVDQTQMDMFGEVAHCIYVYWTHPAFAKEPGRFEREGWPLTLSVANYVAGHWKSAGSGIWEMRGAKQQYTHAKAMCWVALDRAIKLAGDFRISCPELPEWKKQRELLYREFSSKGYNKNLKSYVQTYGSSAADASILRLPLFGVADARDEHMRGTIRLIEHRLLKSGQLYRYRDVDDGVNGPEGTFTVCAFWLIENYVLQGRISEAQVMFRQILSMANDVGLMSEEIDPNKGDLLGNFPQGFSHIGLINVALRLQAAERGREAASRARRARLRRVQPKL